MTKRELIDEIAAINRSADPAFLAKFDDVELLEYLDHLQYTKQLNLTDTQPRWDRHLQPVAAASGEAEADRMAG